MQRYTPDNASVARMVLLRSTMALFLASLLLTGCASTRCAPGRPQVDAQLQSRVNNGLGPLSCSNEPLIPEDVRLDDGVTADEAVAVALWNNSAFNATLARLGMVRGDLTQAGLLRNPQFSLLLPGGTKQLEWTLFLPIDAFLLRETRLDMSEREVCRVAEELVQNGLNLVRDTRVAHADLVFAVDRAALADEAVEVRKKIADLTKKQLDAGDISELEATTARIDYLRAQADAAGLSHAVTQADARLQQLMGIGSWSTSLQPVASTADDRTLHFELPELIAEATTCRPDLQAASFAFAAAQKRAELSRWQWLRFDAVADANSGGAGNTNFGPGFRFDIPVFDRNQGGIQTADWSVNQAAENYNTVRDQIVMDVQTAYSQVQQASDNLKILRSEVLTTLNEAVDLAGKAYADGGASYFLVLQTTSQFLDARTQELQLVADLRRANANLDRSVGRNLQSPELSVQSPEPRIGPESSVQSPEPRIGPESSVQSPEPRISKESSVESPEMSVESSEPGRHSRNAIAQVGGHPYPDSSDSFRSTSIISTSDSSVINRPHDFEDLGSVLRSIADELDAMKVAPSHVESDETASTPVDGAIKTGIRQ